MALVVEPKSVRRATSWDTAVEEGKGVGNIVLHVATFAYTFFHAAYRFQVAGYRDQNEYSTSYPEEAVSLLCRICACIFDVLLDIVLSYR